ncbi:MAG TPA: hypothetical protein VF575_02705 [Candidatus Saccharimonadales bacterium]|jgi:hypothetical protein
MRVFSRRARILFGLLFLIAVVTAGVTLVGSRSRPPSDPSELFYQALQQNLEDKGLTCTITETVGTTTSRQSIALDLASKQQARSTLRAAAPSRSVELEEIVVPSGNFIRYTNITSTDKNAAGKTPDFQKVLNVWGKVDTSKQAATLFGQTALGNCIVPLAHLTTKQARDLTAELQKNTVFKTNMSASTVQKTDTTSYRIYQIAVQPRPYIDFMKRVAKAYGLKDLDTVSAASFDTKKAENMKFYVDTSSGRLAKIEYAAKSRSVVFSDYGVVSEVAAPSKYIAANELQKSLIGQ